MGAFGRGFIAVETLPLRMRATGIVAVLALLLCLSGAAVVQDAKSLQDMLDEMQILRNKVNALQNTVEDQAEQMRRMEQKNPTDLSKIMSRITATETVNAAQSHDLAALGVRLTATEYATQNSWTELVALGDRLQATGQQVGELETETSALSNELSTIDSKLTEVKEDVEQLEENGGVASGPKVAFSAAMKEVNGLKGGKYGAHMVYNSVLTNVGDSYNPETGVFTAPVKGVYFFRFTASNSYHLDLDMGVKMYKNQEEILYNHENGVEDFFSNAVTLELVKGDQVFLMLPPRITVYADSHENSFSGHLLFTV